ncbi:ADP-ribosylation/Crystallin J1 [Sporocytophaga myxococcoides]|uniref:ADP-ribosylation/Crystallin J1 n=1 Tax=Sporocytophaga myxococcoides TaxID=153721 RepID=A0A098LHH7_9BACT|nr:ADP-ribosylglycohydrolase family protein [Sporocytophaga myxococcoides]GAL85877.1 ADP-ribosylation/Crystallin J1 [Sporocytophaga myxococcoides]
MKGPAKDILFGVAIGEAIGLPFESSERNDMLKYSDSNISGCNVYSQHQGMWSHSTALTFCMAESIIDGYDLETTAINFIGWKNKSLKRSDGYVFDHNNTTVKAICRLEKVMNQSLYTDTSIFSSTSDFDNSNGSLMRILPLLYVIRDKPIRVQFNIIWDNSALTHNHIRAAMCCMIYLKVAEHILHGHEKSDAYQQTRHEIKELWDGIDFDLNEIRYFERVIQSDIRNYSFEYLRSGEYVMDSLESSLWCLLKTDSYKGAIQKSINLGGNTSSTGAITGGLAGLYYGFKSIPDPWIRTLSKRSYILKLANRLDLTFSKRA